jgi:hypothetical protein
LSVKKNVLNEGYGEKCPIFRFFSQLVGRKRPRGPGFKARPGPLVEDPEVFSGNPSFRSTLLEMILFFIT